MKSSSAAPSPAADLPFEVPSLTTRQAAKILSWSAPTLARRVSNGTAPASYKLGHARLFRLSDLHAFIESCRQSGERK